MNKKDPEKERWLKLCRELEKSIQEAGKHIIGDYCWLNDTYGRSILFPKRLTGCHILGVFGKEWWIKKSPVGNLYLQEREVEKMVKITPAKKKEEWRLGEI